MIVLLPDGKLINLNLVCFTDTRSFKEPVRFCMVNGESVFCEMTEDQYQALLLSLVHNEPLHKVLPIKEIFLFQGSFSCLDFFQDFSRV